MGRKVQGTVCMQAGENEIFSAALSNQMVGQKTADGWTVIAAKADGNQTIWLTIEGEIDA